MLVKKLLTLAGLSALAQAAPTTEASGYTTVAAPQVVVEDPIIYDALVVGGGPSGLAALSSLARVRRRAILIDSAEYRNAPTRHMHDVPGFDGVTPAYFRYKAREQISDYESVTMANGTVTHITAPSANDTTDGVYVAEIVSSTDPSLNGTTIQARSVILGTGVVDMLPSTPGIAENWGKGIYWCPWCDGTEHADQPMGFLCPLDKVATNYREISTLNSDVVAFVNGTDTPEARAAAAASFGDEWELYLQLNNVTVYNQSIVSVTRLRNGSDPNADPSLATHPEHDLFRIDLADGTSVERAALFTSFGTEMRGTLGQDMGVSTNVTGSGPRLTSVVDKGYLTNLPLVYAVGDNNLDATTNVAHALYTGKKAAIYAHVALARLEVAAQVAAGNITVDAAQKRDLELDPRAVWERMSGTPGDIFDAGEFRMD